MCECGSVRTLELCTIGNLTGKHQYFCLLAGNRKMKILLNSQLTWSCVAAQNKVDMISEGSWLLLMLLANESREISQ